MPESSTYFSPAKINVFLAITGRREDGFHDLVSVVAKLAWGDALAIEPADKDALECADPAVPRDESNLVLKAARLFREATGWKAAAKFTLTKRIPIGAGLGGGSSNGAIALRALNHLAGGLLGEAELAELAAGLGSDCALFLKAGPVVMRGRGERVSELAASGAERLRGRRILLFKPAFGIATPWAYRQMAAAAPGSYLAAAEAESRLQTWLRGKDVAEELLYNNMEPVAFGKFVALPAMLAELHTVFGLEARMSGSGSACFALVPEGFAAEPVLAHIRRGWGGTAFALESRLE